MRFSPSLVAASFAAALLAACAGHGMVPSTSSFAPQSVGSDIKPTVKATPKPSCKTVQGGWIFGGACGTLTLSTSGGTEKLAPYKGIGVSATFSKGSQPNGTLFIVRDALPGTDITGVVNKQSFPALTKHGNVNLKAFLFLKAANKGAAFTFSQTPAIQLTGGTPPGTDCFLAKLLPPNTPQNMTKLWAWGTTNQVPGFVNKAAHTVTFAAFGEPQPFAKNQTVYLGVACVPNG
jgi:hypothetical protein